MDQRWSPSVQVCHSARDVQREDLNPQLQLALLSRCANERERSGLDRALPHVWFATLIELLPFLVEPSILEVDRRLPDQRVRVPFAS